MAIKKFTAQAGNMKKAVKSSMKKSVKAGRSKIDTDLKEIIKNAKKTALRDGYNQDVLKDSDGYGFVRQYPGNLMDGVDEKIGEVRLKWDGHATPNVEYIELGDISSTMKKTVKASASAKRRARKSSVKSSEQNYQSSLKTYADTIYTDIQNISNKCGYTAPYKPKVGTTYGDVSAITIEVNEQYGKNADVNKLDKALAKFFRNSGYTYTIIDTTKKPLGTKYIQIFEDAKSSKKATTVKASASAKRRASKRITASMGKVYYQITDDYYNVIDVANTEEEATALAEKLLRESNEDHYDIWYVDENEDSDSDDSFITTVYADKPFIVEGYYGSDFRGLSDSDTFYDISDAESYAHELLGQGAFVTMECVGGAGGTLRISPDEYFEHFDGEFACTPEIAEWQNAVRRSMGIDASTDVNATINSETDTHVLAEIDEYIQNNYPIYVAAEDCYYIDDHDWGVEIYADGDMVDSDFCYFLNEQNAYLYVRLSEAGVIGGARTNSVVFGEDFAFSLFEAQDEWRAPTILMDKKILKQLGDDGSIQAELSAQINAYKAQFIDALQDLNVRIGYFLESYNQELGINASTEVNADLQLKQDMPDRKKYSWGKNPITDLDGYVKDIADGVIAKFPNLTYEISDEAITFTDENGEVVYIQAIDEIVPEKEDLDDDIAELGDAIQHEQENTDWYSQAFGSDEDDVEASVDDSVMDETTLITYEFPSASGIPSRHVYEAKTFDEAEETCQRIEQLKDEGYKIIDVTREIFDGYKDFDLDIDASIDDDELEPIMGDDFAEDYGFGFDSNGDPIDESTVEELCRIANEILGKSELAEIDPYTSVEEDTFKYYMSSPHVEEEFYIFFTLKLPISKLYELDAFEFDDDRTLGWDNYGEDTEFEFECDIIIHNGKVSDVLWVDVPEPRYYEADIDYGVLYDYVKTLASPVAEEIYVTTANL